MHLEGSFFDVAARVGYQGPTSLDWALCSRFGSGYLIDNMSIAGWNPHSLYFLCECTVGNCHEHA